jgi:hypothetical protein
MAETFSHLFVIMFLMSIVPPIITMLRLRQALEASWGQDTSYKQAYEEGNPALGNCYPTSRIVQHFFPKMEIARGKVWTGTKEEDHFWNVLVEGTIEYHFDLTWQQFPHGSIVKEHGTCDRKRLNDSDATLRRIEILLERVNQHLELAG